MAQQTGTSRSADQLNDAEAIALVESIRYLLKDYDRINAALKAAGHPAPAAALRPGAGGRRVVPRSERRLGPRPRGRCRRVDCRDRAVQPGGRSAGDQGGVEVTRARRVVVPRNVDGLVYGTAGEFGTWFFENYADLGVEVIEGKGGRIFRACEHDGTHAPG